MIICIDFDGTIVEHEFPDIGPLVPGAIEWMKRFGEAGAKLILWTMRSDDRVGKGGREMGQVLTEAVKYCADNGIVFWGININPDQKSWTQSPKAYAKIYIDDAAIGCPLRVNPRVGGRPFVDWDIVGPMVMAALRGN